MTVGISPPSKPAGLRRRDERRRTVERLPRRRRRRGLAATTIVARRRRRVELRRRGLRRRRAVFSRAAPDGEVVKQSPAAQEEVVVGTTVVLNVSKGRQMVEVPNVLDQSEESARAELREAGLQAEVVFAPSSEIEEGNVALQDPGPGEEAPRGSTVTITVSTGPATVTVPGVVGQQREQAEQTLQDAGFEVNVQMQPVADPTQENVVLDQNPDGGSEAPGGSAVTIVVGDFPG
ncbi:MAG: PASTA domain-containing protein [Gaiellaceae bacterium]